MGAHIINRQIIELKVASEKNAFQVQRRVHELYHKEVLPLLDDIMSRLSSDEEVIQIDSLDLDLGVLNFGKLDQQMMQLLRSQIEDQLKNQIGKAVEKKESIIGEEENRIAEI